MRPRRLTAVAAAAAAALLAVCLAACTGGAGQNEGGEEPVGEPAMTVQVELPNTGGYGFNWDLSLEPQGVLELSDRQTIELLDGDDFEGAHVRELFEFKGAAPGEVIAVRQSSKSSPLFSKLTGEDAAFVTVPEWLSLERNELKGTVTRMPERADVDFPVEEHLIVEYYSK